MKAANLIPNYSSTDLVATVTEFKVALVTSRIAKALKCELPGETTTCPHWWFVLSYWNPEAEMNEDNQWIMRPELVQALTELKSRWGR